jgi:hypothetical protein
MASADLIEQAMPSDSREQVDGRLIVPDGGGRVSVGDRPRDVRRDGKGRRSPLSLNSLLAAVDVLAAALAEAIGAHEVSFLTADFSGQSLIRLGQSGGEGALRSQGTETPERAPLLGTPHGRAWPRRRSK